MQLKRPEIVAADLRSVLQEQSDLAAKRLEEYGPGIFIHPQEIVGCMLGQLNKLSVAADKCVYGDEHLDEFLQRCGKTLYAMIMATASTRELIRLRDENEDPLDHDSRGEHRA